ncbi:Gfo/Idh/MocA family protein [Haladaptatus sp. NG-SE-30]
MTVKIAVIGGGTMGRTHATAIAGNPDAELTMVCDIDSEILDGFARADWSRSDVVYGESMDTMPVLGSPESVSTPEEVFAADVDAVSICTPNAFHAPLAQDGLDAGKHVIVEKPMATSVEECRAMLDRAEETERVLHVGHMWRYHQHVNWAQSLVANGEIGEPVKLKAFGIHADWGPGGWFTDPDLAGGGALLDMGIHAIDTAGHILGDPNPVRVYASIETNFGTYEVDDDALLHVTYDDGTRAVVESGWRHPYREGGESAVRIYGSDGYLSVFPTKARIDWGEKTGWFDPSFDAPKDTFTMYQSLIDDFVDCIRNGTPEASNAPTAANAVAVCDAAYESAETGQVIDIE